MLLAANQKKSLLLLPMMMALSWCSNNSKQNQIKSMIHSDKHVVAEQRANQRLAEREKQNELVHKEMTKRYLHFAKAFHGATVQAYTSLKVSDLINKYQVNNRIIEALVKAGRVRIHGKRRGAKYHWCGAKPDETLAEILYASVNNIVKKKKQENAPVIPGRKLVPIANSAKAVKPSPPAVEKPVIAPDNYLAALNSLRDLTLRYGGVDPSEFMREMHVTREFFDNLIALGYLRANNENSHMLWCSSEVPDRTLAELLIEQELPVSISDHFGNVKKFMEKIRSLCIGKWAKFKVIDYGDNFTLRASPLMKDMNLLLARGSRRWGIEYKWNGGEITDEIVWTIVNAIKSERAAIWKRKQTPASDVAPAPTTVPTPAPTTVPTQVNTAPVQITNAQSLTIELPESHRPFMIAWLNEKKAALQKELDGIDELIRKIS